MLSLSSSLLRRRSSSAAAATPLWWLRRALSTASHNNNNDSIMDVLIVGGGVVGLTLAKTLREQAPRFQVGLVVPDKPPTTQQRNDDDTTTTTTSIPHARSYALSPLSLELLGTDIVNQISPRMGFYDSMQVWEQDSPAALIFTHHDLMGTKYADKGYLGAVVEDGPLVSALWNSCLANSNDIVIHQGQATNNITQEDNGIVTVELVDKDTTTSRILQTKLLVAANGAQSVIRQACGIPWKGVQYGRTAVTCTVRLQETTSMRDGRAFQRFVPPGGPMALLPTHDSHHAILVWSTMPEIANQIIQNKSSTTLVEEINSNLQVGPQRLPSLFHVNESHPLSGVVQGTQHLMNTLHYGLTMSGLNNSKDSNASFVAPPLVTEVVSPVLSFPLSSFHAESYVNNHNNIVLVGDAAHTVHPMAGQGLNLGLQDVACLARELSNAHDVGLDINLVVLEKYASQRQFHNTMALHGIHALHSLFGLQSNNNNHHDDYEFPQRLVHHVKSLGMNTINAVGPFKRTLAAIAAGAV